MTIEIIDVKPVKPTYKAVQIPFRCTMAEADEIEKAFFSVKRSDWDASSDLVYKFSLDGKAINPGSWVVETTNPVSGHTERKLIGEYEFKYQYKEKS